ncbi:hypothetical protein ACQP2X_09800 [Actinoplanes sp. CA-131856]
MSERTHAPRSGGRAADQQRQAGGRRDQGTGRDADTRSSAGRGARHFTDEVRTTEGADTRRSGIARDARAASTRRRDGEEVRGGGRDTATPRGRTRNSEEIRTRRDTEGARARRDSEEIRVREGGELRARRDAVGARRDSEEIRVREGGELRARRDTSELRARDTDGARKRRDTEDVRARRDGGEGRVRRDTGELRARRDSDGAPKRRDTEGVRARRGAEAGDLRGRRGAEVEDVRGRRGGEVEDVRGRRDVESERVRRITEDVRARRDADLDDKVKPIAAKLEKGSAKATRGGQGGDRRLSGLPGAEAPVAGTAALQLEVAPDGGGRAEAGAGPRLSVAPAPVRRGPRAPFAAGVVGLVIVGVLGILLINTKTNENSFKIADLEKQNTALDNQRQDLDNQLIQVSSVGNLDAAARRLGLVKADNIAVLRLPDGKQIGVPMPAEGKKSVTEQPAKTDTTTGGTANGQATNGQTTNGQTTNGQAGSGQAAGNGQ